MTKAFLDTTILADYLLKPSTDKGLNAKAALREYDETELPVYAIKEFKAGVLRGYIWLHNTFKTENNYQRTLIRAHALSTSLNRNLALTAQEALAEASSYFGSFTSPQLIEKYGDKAKADSMMVDANRYRLKQLINRGWNKRRKITTRVVIPLPCYPEVSPFEDNKGLIEFRPHTCDPIHECSLANALRSNLSDVKSLRKVVERMPTSGEQKRRFDALNAIARAPRKAVTEKMCRALGDALFAFLAPQDSVILTTNTKDHEPLAAALGKNVERPKAI